MAAAAAAAPPWLVTFVGGERIFSAGFEKMRDQLAQRGLDAEICVERRPDPDAASDVLVPLMSRIDRAMIESLPRLKAIVQFGVGLEGVDLDAARERGVAVLNMPADKSGNATSTAEVGLYLCLAAMRRQRECEASFRTRGLGVPIGVSLERKRVLIVGFGAVGKKLREMIRPFDTRVALMKRGWDGLGGPSPAADVDAFVGPPPPAPETRGDVRVLASDAAALGKVLGAADVVFLCTTLNESTRNMVDGAFIGRMKDGSFLVNVSRGGVIEYEALLAALRAKKFLGVGLDVFWYEPFDPDDPIFEHEEVVRTPHVGGVTDVSYNNMSRILIDTVRALQGGAGWRDAIPEGAALVVDGAHGA